MKVIGGDWRGKELLLPKKGTFRPTLAVVKQALFNIFQNEWSGATLLDLCSGSGAIGFEALSRGARSVHFVEPEREALHHLRRNRHLLLCQERSHIWPLDGLSALRRMAQREISFDFIYIDPPYPREEAESLVVREFFAFLDQKPMVSQGGRVILELPKGKRIPDVENQLHHEKSHKIHDVVLHFFIRRP